MFNCNSNIRLVLYVFIFIHLAYLSSCKEASSAERDSNKEVITPPNKRDIKDGKAGFSDSIKKKKDQTCPVCGKWKNATEDLCSECYDEIANTCYKCGRYAYNVNGALCDDCKIHTCPICNGRKDSQDDLCADCHNLIEEQSIIKIKKRK